MIPPLRDGTQLSDAERRLRETASQVRNIASSSAGQSLQVHQNTYLAWVGIAESQLRNIFIDPTTWEPLYGERFWRIRDITQDSPRWMELINHEADLQAAWLEKLAERLKKLSDRLSVSPGQLAVLDTNILLHFMPPDQVDWPIVVGARQVRLVLPLRVIEELDEKKYMARDDLAARARQLLSQLRSRLAASAGGPTPLRSGVTIEVPIEDEPRRRTLDADEEILDSCRELRLGSQGVVLLTDDCGMTLRALSQGLRVSAMPEAYLRRKPRSESDGGSD